MRNGLLFGGAVGHFELIGNELEGYFSIMNMFYIFSGMVVVKFPLSEHIKLYAEGLCILL